MAPKILFATGLALGTLFAVPATPAHAGTVCRDMPKIHAAFSERLEYETRRAKRRGLSVSKAHKAYRRIGNAGSCHDVWERHRAFLDTWARRIDRKG